MPRGRPPLGADLVQHLKGSSAAKQRLTVILQTLAQHKPVPLACAELGINTSRFHALRNQVLQRLLEDLEPKVIGRPRRIVLSEETRISELERQVQDLKIELQAAQVREEIAVLMPHLLRRGESPTRSRMAASNHGSGGKKRRRPGRAQTHPAPFPASRPGPPTHP